MDLTFAAGQLGTAERRTLDLWLWVACWGWGRGPSFKIPFSRIAIIVIGASSGASTPWVEVSRASRQGCIFFPKIELFINHYLGQ